MVAFPPCKINLGLRIIAKRADGYHDLETCFYPVPWNDVLEVIHAREISFTYSGHVIDGDPSANLCVKAYDLLHRDFALGPVAVHLHKIIPMGAGLGGGSSDGAYMLRLLDELFALHLGNDRLAKYAAMLGSDCAFFIYDMPMIGRGRGEILSPVDLTLKGTYAVLLKPGLHISMAAAFAGITPRKPGTDIATVVSMAPAAWRDHLSNDFEHSLFPKFPVLAELKSWLYSAGAFYAGMSGSGSTVYGLFEQRPLISQPQAWVASGITTWEGWL